MLICFYKLQTSVHIMAQPNLSCLWLCGTHKHHQQTFSAVLVVVVVVILELSYDFPYEKSYDYMPYGLQLQQAFSPGTVQLPVNVNFYHHRVYERLCADGCLPSRILRQCRQVHYTAKDISVYVLELCHDRHLFKKIICANIHGGKSREINVYTVLIQVFTKGPS